MIVFMYYMGFTFTDAERSGAGLRGVSRVQRGQSGSDGPAGLRGAALSYMQREEVTETERHREDTG